MERKGSGSIAMGVEAFQKVECPGDRLLLWQGEKFIQLKGEGEKEG